MFSNLHHVQCRVKDVNFFSDFLIDKFCFTKYAYGNFSNNSRKCVVLKHGHIRIIIFKGEDANIDSVCDVALSCDDIYQVLQRIDEEWILTPLTKVENNDGILLYAIVKSPVGNVQHTLLDKSKYNGSFLPGFKLVDSYNHKDLDFIQNIDHIAFALNIGQSDEVFNWYNKCFEFNRILVNQNEDKVEGFVVKEGERGLRLKAMLGPLPSYDSEFELSDLSLKIPKFVLVESLKSSSKDLDQIANFLANHGGPGVQHIAFNSHNIVNAVSHFKSKGLALMNPPDAYYNQDRGSEMQYLDYNWESLKKNNILWESNLNHKISQQINKLNNNFGLSNQIQQLKSAPWFIMQVFTVPVFEEKTMFFEIIQRHKTVSGFGAGNIGALWRAVQNTVIK